MEQDAVSREMLRWMDSHAHLDSVEFEENTTISDVLERAIAAGALGILLPSVDAESVVRVRQIVSDSQRKNIAISLRFGAGIQPHSTHEIQEDDWSQLVAATDDPYCVAVGEIGLDYYWELSPIATQRVWFERQLRLARKRDLPVLIHCREGNVLPGRAAVDVVATLREIAMESDAAFIGPLRGVIHSFSGDEAFAKACLELGFYLSFSGVLTYPNRKFQTLREVAKRVPIDRILVETDSPYLTPTPLRGKRTNTINEPAMIVHTLERLAAERGVSMERMATATVENTLRLFRWTISNDTHSNDTH